MNFDLQKKKIETNIERGNRTMEKITHCEDLYNFYSPLNIVKVIKTGEIGKV
jgi:hypothetical protein